MSPCFQRGGGGGEGGSVFNPWLYGTYDYIEKIWTRALLNCIFNVDASYFL